MNSCMAEDNDIIEKMKFTMKFLARRYEKFPFMH